MILDWKIIALFLVGLLLWWFFFLSISHAQHQRAAIPRQQLLIIVFGILALVCIGGGILAIVASARSRMEFSILGARFTAGHIGLGFVGAGLAIVFFIVRAKLKNQRELAGLPHDPKKRDQPKDSRER